MPLSDLMRWQLREKKRRSADPSLIVMDTQSIRVAVGVPSATTGKDAAKRVPGLKRCLAVDVPGLVVEAVVLPASAHDSAAGIALLDGVAARMGTVAKARTGRRPVRDHDRLTTSRSRVFWAMTSVMFRRLTGAMLPSWRAA